MNTPIPENMVVNSVTHSYAGNEWAVVSAYPNDWASVVAIGKGTVGSQIFSVWTRKLTVENPIEPKTLARIQKIRADLESGKMAIKDTRLVAMSQCEP